MFDIVNPEQAEQLKPQYIELCRKHGLNPVILREILYYRNKGFNNFQIEQQTGISRFTVANYLEKIRGMENEDFGKLILLGVVLLGLYYLAKER